jgi:hypothetical protein
MFSYLYPFVNLNFYCLTVTNESTEGSNDGTGVTLELRHFWYCYLLFFSFWCCRSALFNNNFSSVNALLCSLQMISFTRGKVMYRVGRYGHIKLSLVDRFYTV